MAITLDAVFITLERAGGVEGEGGEDGEDEGGNLDDEARLWQMESCITRILKPLSIT